PNDVVVTVSLAGAYLHDQATGFNQNFTLPFPEIVPTQNIYAVTDLSGNGYADIVFINSAFTTPFLSAITAADTSDETKGFFFGTPIALPPNVGFPFGLAAG